MSLGSPALRFSVVVAVDFLHECSLLAAGSTAFEGWSGVRSDCISVGVRDPARAASKSVRCVPIVMSLARSWFAPTDAGKKVRD